MNWKDQIKALNWEDFHFLRPQWLWLFALLVVILLLVITANNDFLGSSNTRMKWKQKIAAPLRKYMFSKANKWSMMLPIIFTFLFFITGILAMAGPTWKRVEVPGMKSTAVFHILMDLSWSMMAEDVQPNRIERAQLKLHDLLDANPRARTGLTVFAGTPHIVLPLTTDYELIKHHATHLNPVMMPVRGGNLQLAMKMMDTLFKKELAPSTLLILTDKIEAEDMNILFRFVDKTPHRLEILPIGTPEGALIPSFQKKSSLKNAAGKPLISKADPVVWEQLNKHSKIIINTMTLDKSDVEKISQRVSEKLIFELESSESEEEWQDMGILFLIPAILFTLLFFRKGWMVQWCIILGCFTLTSCGPYDKTADLWYTPDYKAYLYEEDGNYEDAAATYQDMEKKGIAYFKANDLEAAANLFEQDSSATGLYNYGITLSNLGEYEKAQQVLSRALVKDPSLEQAKTSLNLVAEAIIEMDSINRFDPEAFKQKKKGNLTEIKPEGKDEELSSDTEVDELPKDGERITDEVESDVRKAEELEFPPEDTDAAIQENAQKILLRKISAEPEEFLRRRFKYQRIKYYPNIKEGEKKW